MGKRLLVVDDEKLIRWSLRERLGLDGHTVIECPDGAEARRRLMADSVDLALFDLRLPDTDGMSLLKWARELYPDLPVIIITAYSSVDNAVQAMQAGASDYITKPFNMDELALKVQRALDASTLRVRVSSETHAQQTRFGLASLLGESAVMQQFRLLIAKIARSETPTVLILGETGSGKGLVAKALHYESSRADRPFMNITCTALPEHLLESELFGHEKGAFTDAKSLKRGLFELADGGTVFLDEVGDLSLALQAKLLRVLEDKTFRRVGGTVDIAVDIRIVAATNRDLDKAIEQEAFRPDLYYRLSMMPVTLPPLREREGDVPLLAAHFAQQCACESGRPGMTLAPAALAKLAGYGWPGNIRELRNVIERAVLLSAGNELDAEDIMLGRLAARGAAASADGVFSLPPGGCDLAKVEEMLIRQALERTGGNRTHAAALLGLSRDQIRYKISQYGL